MSPPIKRKTAAHVVPFLAFMVLLAPVPLVKVINPELPWWRSHPEHWIYPLQAVLCLGLLLFWRRDYRFGKPRMVGMGLLAGLAGIGIWLSPAILGWQDRSEGGFDPTLFDAGNNPVSWWIVVGVRFLRLVVVVPLVEEIFWRGFLMRWLLDSPGRWDEAGIGTYGHKSFWITTGLIGLAHWGPDFWVALIWGALIGFVTVKAKNLWAPVMAHAAANLVLGIVIMKTGWWGLW